MGSMMDFDARLKALARLSESTTAAAEKALRKEFDVAATVLIEATDYHQLERCLEVIDTIGFRFSAPAVDALTVFTRSIDSRALTYSAEDRLFGGRLERYRNSASLISKAIQALVRLRYLQTRKVLHALRRLSIHSAEGVRKKSREGLAELAGYNITVFYGDGRQGGIGATPQMQVLDELRRLSALDLITYLSAHLTVLDEVLSPTMKSASWTYNAVTLSHSATPSVPTISDVRFQSIEMLIHVYGLVTAVEQKLLVIGSLTGATRTESRKLPSDEAISMFARDAEKVLSFFAERIETDDLEIVQKIEHNSYWVFYHAVSERVKVAALKVREKISERNEYQYYRILVGFDGIFGEWQALKEDRPEWKDTDELRRTTACQYAKQIAESNYSEWRDRIIKYAETKSDDLATFPVFYYFLERFAIEQPALALKLLLENGEAIKGFLIPLLRGLWPSTHQEQVRALIETWIGDGRNLYPSIKQFLSNANLDLELAKRLLSKAVEKEDVLTIREAVSVAVSNYSSNRQNLVEELMLPAIEMLTERFNCDWLFDNWFRKEMKEVLAALEPNSIDVILRNLKHLRKLDYHAEEVLSIIAWRDPKKILQYLCERLKGEPEGELADQARSFEAIPFELHKLNDPLSRVPSVAVRNLRERYDGDYSNFIHGGARLLANIFPKFSEEFEQELLRLVQEGGEANLEFVVAILRNYQGELFTHTLCKEIVKSVPTDSLFRTEVAIALESSGVVSGEFGMAHSYERKRQQVLEWMADSDPQVQDFAKWYIADLEAMRDAEQRRADEGIALRKFRYGEE